MKTFKVGFCYSEGSQYLDFENLKSRLKTLANVRFEKFSAPEKFLNKKFQQQIDHFDIVVVDVPHRINVMNAISASTTNSHFINYSDLLTKEDGQWWGNITFGRCMKKLIIEVLKFRDFRGPVIFLGESPICLPIVGELANFSFRDIVFLDVGRPRMLSAEIFAKATRSILNLDVSVVDSTTFIQSQTEYALCFVTEKEYSQQVLEDMGYFHFLSPRSTVFDISGGSNFLYDDVKALGFNMYPQEVLRQMEIDEITHSIITYIQTRP